MPYEQDQAVVLRLTEYSETSQIATLFGHAGGLLRLIAKGSRRSTRTRFAVGLDLLELGQVIYVPPRGDAQLATLTEWTQQASYAGLRRAPARLYGGLHAAELVAGLTEEGDPHPELFTGLVELLGRLDGDAEPSRVVAVFQHTLLRAIGYAPELTMCVECKRAIGGRQVAYFSARAGGALCRDCELHHTEKRRLPAGLVGQTPATGGDPYDWFALLDYHLTHVAAKRFRTADMLGRLLRTAARNER